MLGPKQITIKECGKLWNYFSYCRWGGTITRANEAWNQLEQIRINYPVKYILGMIFSNICGV